MSVAKFSLQVCRSRRCRRSCTVHLKVMLPFALPSVRHARTSERTEFELTGRCGRTEELLAATLLLDDLNQARLQLLDRRNVRGEDTHIARLGGDVDLNTVRHSVS